MAICARCDAENPDNSRFCNACGAALFVDVQQGGEERRIVTALFADLVGSTAIAERLDAEDAQEVLGGAIDRVIAIIEHLGGTVHDLAGDGALALFGAPRAHEDDPERAVLAGLAICRETRAYADSVARDWQFTEFGIRVGIETGLAVVGPSGGGLALGRAVGDVLNTAARLQSHAVPGTVLVGETTRLAVASRFDWGSARALDLKGKREPVMATVALRPSRATRASGNRAGAETALIGREDEFAVIEQAVADLRAGKGSVVLLSGDPGVGKSRLLDRVLRLADGAERRG